MTIDGTALVLEDGRNETRPAGLDPTRKQTVPLRWAYLTYFDKVARSGGRPGSTRNAAAARTGVSGQRVFRVPFSALMRKRDRLSEFSEICLIFERIPAALHRQLVRRWSRHRRHILPSLVFLRVFLLHQDGGLRAG